MMAGVVGGHGRALHQHEAAARQMRDQTRGNEAGHEFIGVMHTATTIETQSMSQGFGNIIGFGSAQNLVTWQKLLRHQNKPWTNHAPSPDQRCAPSPLRNNQKRSPFSTSTIQ